MERILKWLNSYKSFCNWDLVIGDWILFGAWDLVIGIYLIGRHYDLFRNDFFKYKGF